MPFSFRFAIISDPHIALPHTIGENPHRFHLVEVSIPAIEQVLAHLEALDLDFVLLPGDLTQHGEPDNHQWLVERLSQLPFPAYVVPGNHDVIQRSPTPHSIGLADFPQYYQKFGYGEGDRPYYSQEVLPGVQLIGLNSNGFDSEGKPFGTGHINRDQLEWLDHTLSRSTADLVMVMVHHNLLEHLPNQAAHGLGRRYIIGNAAELLAILKQHQVPLVFTGHLHVQDVARSEALYDITTGSLVTYPHPYRILHCYSQEPGDRYLRVETEHIRTVPGFPDLHTTSREWMGDRSHHFMTRLLTDPPLNLPLEEAQQYAPDMRYFWAEIAQGDRLFDFPHFPPAVRQHLRRFSAITPQGDHAPIDNSTLLRL